MDRDSDKRHFRILDGISRDLSVDTNFPSCLDAALMVRDTLREPNVSLERISQAVAVEPLIASKLLRLANSVPYNPSGQTIADLKTAISRLGLEAVRTTSLAVAMDQMLKSGQLKVFEAFAKQAWEHSLQLAAICRVLARRLGRINPDEALLTGMVHNIGIFYLLYRAADYPEYQDNLEAAVDLVAGWHQSIGSSLLYALGLPQHIVEALHDRAPLPGSDAPCDLTYIVYIAGLLAGDGLAWLPGTHALADSADHADDRNRYADLLEEAQDDIRELRAALGA